MNLGMLTHFIAELTVERGLLMPRRRLISEHSIKFHQLNFRRANIFRQFLMLSLEQPIEGDDSNVLYDVMRKEVRQAVEEIRNQLEKVSF